MARFILKWRYIKSGSAKHSTNLVKYIATREGVEKCDDFPDTVQSFEYQDYTSTPTKLTASEFISRAIEENVDLIGKKENYVGYIAKRPHVEKQGSHGLFTQADGEIDLQEVAKTVAEHEGAVWTTIMSLRREDAEKLGFDNAKMWRDLLRGQSNKLAKAMGIPLTDLRWYAAFHNEGNHPHIHLVSYSVGREPYMTEQGLQNFKADFAREIFRQDNLHIYQEQTAYRDELRRTGREKMSAIIQQINNGAYDNDIMKLLLRDLVQEPDGYTGKKVYGYMPKKAKNLIDGIVDELAKDDRIAELYNLWYEQRDNIIRTYQDAISERVPLSRNKEFKTIKNAVIQEALNLLHNRITFEDEMTEQEYQSDDSEHTEEPKRNPWTDPEDMHYQYLRGKSYLDMESEDFDPEEAIKWLEMSALQGFDIAMYRLGKLYLQGEVIEKDITQALYWLHKADAENNQYAQYLLGKLFLNGTEVEANCKVAEEMFNKASMQGSSYAKYSLAKMHLTGKASYSNIAFAVHLLTEAANQGNQWAEYQLGKMYLYGQGVDKNYELAVRLLSSSADKGNQYAQQLLENYHPYTQNNSATILASLRLLARLSQIIRDDADKRDKSGRAIDRKLMRKIEQKKQAQGQKMS